MIASVRGTLTEASAARVVVEVGGVGYLLQSPESTLRALPAIGDEVYLHVHTHVREDAIQLFGFASRAELRLFETVVGVGGIGPRLALAILSHLSVDAFVRAVIANESRLLTRIPGIGPKTAARILLELKDKLEKGGWSELAGPAKAGAAKGAAGVDEDALAALVALGYSETEASAAVRAAVAEMKDGAAASVQQLIKAALGKLDRAG